MALKITEVNGKLALEGNINFVTEQLLKQHIQIIKEATLFEDKGKSRKIKNVA